MSRLVEYLRRSKARVMVAIDDPSLALSELSKLVNSLSEVVAGFKVGIPYLLGIGLDRLSEVVRGLEDIYFLADLKLADIGTVMKLTTKLIRNAGFSGVIAHGFVGFNEGLDELSNYCNELGLDLFIVVSMSHLGSLEVYDVVLDKVLDVVRKTNAAGVIAPATRPEVIKYVRNTLGEHYMILSPGVGVQGAQPGSAICAGADVEIVGRAITTSSNPVDAARELIRVQEELIRRCRRVS